jgi:1,4-alpha-glucan branching enzyme
MPVALRWVTRLVLRRVARVIVLGHCLKKIFDGLVPPDRISVIPNGIRYQEFDELIGSKSRDGQKRILFLSSLRERKGVFLLLEALRGVFHRHPDACVTFAGRWRSAAEESRARELIERLGIAERCKFVGEVTGAHKIRLYAQHDVFVFPPIEPEGLPWVVLEAMSARLPVIATDQGAISEAVEDGITGFIVPPSASSLEEKLCYTFENPQIAAEMGRAGYGRVVDRFSEQAYLTRLTNLFWEVVQHGCGRDLAQAASVTSASECNPRSQPFRKQQFPDSRALGGDNT